MTVFVAPVGAAARVSVVLPVFDDGARLDASCRALAAQDFAEPVEVLVVDAGHADPALTASLGVRVVRGPVAAPHHARRAGITLARAEIVVLTEAGATFGPGWLSEVVRAFDTDPEVVVSCGPSLRAGRSRLRRRPAGELRVRPGRHSVRASWSNVGVRRQAAPAVHISFGAADRRTCMVTTDGRGRIHLDPNRIVTTTR